MNYAPIDHDPPAGSVPIEIPAPKNVGPRPAGASAGTIHVPRGLERLLAMAGLNGEWRNKMLSDPLQAAQEANIPLSGSEAVILRTIPSQTLRQMITVFAREGVAACKRPALSMGTAAAALLATEMNATAASPDGPVSLGKSPTPAGEVRPSRGIRPDVPGVASTNAPSVQTHIAWAASLDEAKAMAAQSNCAIMVVFPMGSWPRNGEVIKLFFGMVADQPWLERRPSYRSSELLSNLCQRGSAKIAAAIQACAVIPLRCLTDDDREYAMRWMHAQSEHEVPQVVFLTSNGDVLHAVMNPADEDALIKAVRSVPALLATWINKKRTAEQQPPAAEGRRSEYPAGKAQP
ncbi:MAG: hypothetical protein WCR06_02875 [bacterium]